MNKELIEQQDHLQQKAQQVLEKLDLINLISKYGTPEVVGSMALGLMCARDIDFEIACPKLDKNFIAEIVNHVVKLPIRRTDFIIADNSDQFNQDSPKSLYTGLKYFGDELGPDEIYGSNPKAWNIDMHFLLTEDVRTKKKTEEIKSKLTDQTKEIILKLKNEFTQNPNYHKTFFSMDIYQAVLYKGVEDTEGFKKYLSEICKEF